MRVGREGSGIQRPLPAGLRCGRPTIVVPFFGDQPFWGERVHSQGVGPPPIPHELLTGEKLAEVCGASSVETGVLHGGEAPWIACPRSALDASHALIQVSQTRAVLPASLGFQPSPPHRPDVLSEMYAHFFADASVTDSLPYTAFFPETTCSQASRHCGSGSGS